MGDVVRLRGARGEPSPLEKAPVPSEPDGYLNALDGWPGLEDLSRRDREQQLFQALGAWRRMLLMDPSDCSAVVQLRAASAAWINHIEKMHLRAPEAS